MTATKIISNIGDAPMFEMGTAVLSRLCWVPKTKWKMLCSIKTLSTISNVGQKSTENLLVMMETNKNLQKELICRCLQLEESEKALLLKVELLRSELRRYQRDGEILANHLANLYAVKVHVGRATLG